MQLLADKRGELGIAVDDFGRNRPPHAQKTTASPGRSKKTDARLQAVRWHGSGYSRDSRLRLR